MKHLGLEEIIDFVQLDKFDDGAKALISRVNLHIRECEECLELVKQIEDIYDDMVALGMVEEFRSTVYECYGMLSDKEGY